MKSRLRRNLTILLVGSAWLAARAAWAEEPSRSATTATSLRGRIGVDAASQLGASERVADRLRGLERLGSAGTPRALSRLIHAIEPGGTATTAVERLTAVRVLAGFTDDPDVRRTLARVMGGHATPSSAAPPVPLDVLAQETAGVALARAGTPDALAALGKGLVTPGPAGHAAHVALVANPPATRDALAALLGAATLPTLELASTLADLADPRGEDALRSLVLRGAPDVRAVAAVALARAGDPEAVPLAERWRDPRSPSVLRVAAARILVIARSSDAPAAIASLLAGDETASDGIALAIDAPAPSLAMPLSRLLDHVDTGGSGDVVKAIGRAGGPDAVRMLAPLLGDAARSMDAADALARIPGPDAARALGAALAVPGTRRNAARAGIVRWLVTRELLLGLSPNLTALAASKDAVERALGTAGLAALDPAQGSTLMGAKDALGPSVAPLLLLAPREVATRVATRIASAPSAEVRTALALSLAVPGAEDRVPTSVLVALVDANDAASPLAARALGARDEARLRPTITSLLASADPALRAHVALGLGRSAAPDATGLLDSAYRFETDVEARVAMATALASRPDGSPALALGRDLDPDPRVRRAARSDRASLAAAPLESGSETLWIVAPPSRSGATPRPMTIALPDGLRLPVVPGPDGCVLAAGLPTGSRVLRVAPAHEADDDSRRGASGNEKSERGEAERAE